jgi:very-short-patch-repair endonuclease
MEATPDPPVSPPPLAARLGAARQELLDLGLRNPLLNWRPSPARGVTVVQQQSAAVYDGLVRQGKTLYFQAAPEPPNRATDESVAAAAQNEPAEAPAAEVTDRAGGAAQRERSGPASLLTSGSPALGERGPGEEAPFTNNQLQTAEPPAKLESRLLNTYYTARTSLEEQGVNILYLALGQLVWYEADSSPEPRRAPLVLVPVLLERGSAADRFRLRHTGAEVEGNLSLQAKLRASFGLGLPLPEPDEETAVADYLAAVSRTVAGLPRWRVEPDAIVLGFFSFGKFMLYRDLDPANWPAEAPLLAHPAIEALLGPETGFRDPAPSIGDEAFLDAESPAHELHQVLDADSSQLLALLAVHEGRNLVIQGPPGTGKSQTIANLLAEAIGAGQRVLFVAEKMAALEVVKRRLDHIGLGVACLELHSHKANKKAVLDELQATLSLGRPAAVVDDQLAQLPRYRQALNDYALAVNAPIGRSRRTAQRVAGELLQLRQQPGTDALPRIAFARLATWTDADAAHAEALAARLQATLQKIGAPKQLLFWGSELTVLLPAEQQQLAGLLTEAQRALEALQTAAAALAASLQQPAPADRLAAEALLPLARHVQLAPPLAGAHAADAGWLRQAARLDEVLAAGAAYIRLHEQYGPQLLPEAWAQQLLPERAALLAYGGKWWKPLSGDYRRARLRLQSLWRHALPDDSAPLVAAIDAIHDAARHARTVAEASGLMESLFGPAWQQLRSDWPALRRTADYLTLSHQRVAQGQLPASVLEYLRAPTSPGLLPAQLAALEAALTRQRAALQALAGALQLNEARRFGPEGRLQLQPFAQQAATLAAWSANLPALHQAVEWNNVAQADGLPELLLQAETWPGAARQLAAAVRQTWLEHLQRQAYEQHPALRQFERAGHEETAARFRRADRALLHYHRMRALRRHHEQLPNPQAGGQMLLLRHEFAKKARHLPLRRLMAQAGRAVQAIKPVFMMSPLSVAGLLPPGAVEFDLVVFDEASQVKPVDALGAIARGRQLVVVGDSRQLPPTSFFDALTGGGEEADEENVTADIQSILELCKARQMPERMLRWHYRSRHQSLIAASNHLYYQNQLVIFPSPGGQERLGLVYHHLPDTYYERGTTRTNPLEAQAVAEAVLRHARTTPGLTLGVVAFSAAQRQAVQDALEHLRRQHPETESFFNRHPHEPFFVKSLENVQGDERDVILISVGYGRTREGYLALSFGPLNGPGGERRLNVLITRAKQRCEVFTNLSADDLDLARTQAQGVADLKTFLHFAQHGRLRPDENTGRPPDSPFEAAVQAALTARGYTLHPQVGSQGFFIDLAVVDPGQPGRYVLGIECDGAMYHSARSARDRDRLRQQVLEAVGWRLHRIWSTDWFRDPAGETERAVQAIERARRPAALEQPEEEEAAGEVTVPAGIEREEAAGAAAAPAEPYQVAQLPAAVAHRGLHQHSLGQLAGWLTSIVRIESPVHIDEATRRLAQASGARQVGPRMQRTVESAVALALSLRHLRRVGDFLWENTMQQPPLRDRSALPAISRKLPLVAPEELARALRTVTQQSFALPRDAAFLATVRLLGFSRLTDDMRQQLDGVLTGLLERRELEDVAEVLRPLA